MARPDGRRPDQLRPLKITRHFLTHPEGSVLVESGDTKVICTASLEDKVPPFLKGSGKGWVTAEYGMLPRSTQNRQTRDYVQGHPSGRVFEIQRLIGRSLRAVTELAALGERTIWLDCDVIQADGGTRTAGINGAFVALIDCLDFMRQKDLLTGIPVHDFLAAISAGIVDGRPILDLCYAEDSAADVDMNLVFTGAGRLVEIQGTGEEATFSGEELDKLLALARVGAREIIAVQKEVLGGLADEVGRFKLGVGPRETAATSLAEAPGSSGNGPGSGRGDA
ncbi:MAG: ribonuclease PH [Bacillota bacterium]